MIDSHASDEKLLRDINHACLEGGYALDVYDPDGSKGYVCKQRHFLRMDTVFDSRKSKKWVLELIPIRFLKRAELRAIRPTTPTSLSLRPCEIVDSLLTSQASLEYFAGKDTLGVYFDGDGMARKEMEKLTHSADGTLLSSGCLGALVFRHSVESLNAVLPKFLDQETYDEITLAIFDSRFVQTTFTTFMEENTVVKDKDRFYCSMFAESGHLVITKCDVGQMIFIAPKEFPMLPALSEALEKAKSTQNRGYK